MREPQANSHPTVESHCISMQALLAAVESHQTAAKASSVRYPLIAWLAMRSWMPLDKVMGEMSIYCRKFF